MHDKPCVDEPSSNNGFIYSAYNTSLNLDMRLVKCTFADCQISGNESRIYFINRLPNKMFPPISRDEIIGMVSLGFNPLCYGWFMYREIGKPNYWLALKTLWKIRKEHRNTFWEKEYFETFCVALKLWFHDRWYINKMLKRKNNIFYYIMFNLYALLTILQDNISAKNVLWLQLKDTDSKFWIKFIDQKGNFKKYFGDTHPLTENL